MTFISGSITDANPGPALYALIATPALALGWTLDDTVVIGSNTHKVLKSAAAGNTYGLDWFLDINYPTTGITGGMRFAPFEGYTAASDVGLRGPYSLSNTTIDATTYSRYGATTSALETNWANAAANTGLSATLSTSAFNYWVSITRDRIIVMTSLQTTSVFYAGFFTPTSQHTSHAGAALFPLVMCKVVVNTNAATANGATATAAFTRIPKATSVNWQTSGLVGSEMTAIGWAFSGVVGTGASEFNGLTRIAPLPVVMGAATITTSATALGHVGYLDGLATGFVVGTAVRGDTVTVGSDTWYSTTVSSNTALFMAGV